MWRLRSFLRVHVFWMPSSLQKPHMKAPFCLVALAAAVAGSLDWAAASSVSHVASSVWAGVVLLLSLLWLLRPRNLALRATLERLDMMLLRDDVSEKARMLLPESKMLGASSDLTDE